MAVLDADAGAYGYLSGYLDGTGGLVRLDITEIEEKERELRVFANDRLEVDAVHVPHGIVPALAFRVATEAGDIVFASDQNGSDPAFIGFAKDADVLVVHMAVPEGATGGAVQLHSLPSRLGEIARDANVGRLVLSHFMARSLRDLEGNIAALREAYGGPLTVAADLSCIALD